MSALSYFIGTPQSKYASVAMILAVLVICLAIIFTNTDVPVGNRIAVAVFVLLMSIFPIAISLFELTCIVTGGRSDKYNLCGIFAWFVTILIVIYSFLLILVTLTSMFTYKQAYDKLEVAERFTTMSKDAANDIAKNMLAEKFEEPSVPAAPVAPAALAEAKKDKKQEPAQGLSQGHAKGLTKGGEWSGYEKLNFMPLK